jgi:hypothetical protein
MVAVTNATTKPIRNIRISMRSIGDSNRIFSIYGPERPFLMFLVKTSCQSELMIWLDRPPLLGSGRYIMGYLQTHHQQTRYISACKLAPS